MTSTGSKEFYENVPPDVARHIIEGGRAIGPVVEVSLGYKDGKAWFVTDGRNDAGDKIAQILGDELGRLPTKTKTGLTDIIKFISRFVPDGLLPLFQIEVWFSVPDGGGTRVDVITRLTLPAASIPDVAKAAARARSRVLEEVCKE